MLEKPYQEPETLYTSDMYRELSLRTGVEQGKLKMIFATFYDVVSEKIVEENVKNISFDKALNFYSNHTPEEIIKHDNGNLEIKPEKLHVSVKLGDKIKYRIIDLYNQKKEFS